MKTLKVEKLDKVVNYKIQYNSRRKKLSYRYLAENTALVLAPIFLSEQDIAEKLSLSSERVYRFIGEQHQLVGKKFEIDGVSSVYYQGELFKIEVKEALITGDAQVDFETKTITLDMQYNLYAMKGREDYNNRVKYKVKRLLFGDAFSQIGRLYNDIYAEVAERIGYTGAKPKLAVKEYKSKWGCYNKKHNLITMNIHMMQASEEEVKAVLVHEICHTMQMNHSRNFYALMDKAMPSHREINLKTREKTTSYTSWIYS